MTDPLSKAPIRYDRKPPEFDDPGELLEAPPESLPDDRLSRGMAGRPQLRIGAHGKITSI